jgi:hypothetical protein
LKISFSKSPLLIKCAKPHLCVFVPELCASQELLARILWPDGQSEDLARELKKLTLKS